MTIARRNGPPNRRALLGGLLIALAVLGTFALSNRAGADDENEYLVASRALAAGTRLSNDDLASIRLPLRGSVASSATTNRAAVVGMTVVGPMRPGELVQAGALIDKRSGAGSPEISFALPSARAVGGDLRSGETVDVLVTRKNAEMAKADVAVSDATVVKVTGAGNGLGRSGEVTITLALRSRDEGAVLAAALDGATVTLERTTGLPPVTP